MGSIHLGWPYHAARGSWGSAGSVGSADSAASVVSGGRSSRAGLVEVASGAGASVLGTAKLNPRVVSGAAPRWRRWRR